MNELSHHRRLQIARRLSEGQPVVAIALAREFQISEDAIRRDLRALAAEGRCRRVYGGAVPLANDERPLSARTMQDRAEKQALARAAVGEVTPGEVIFIDAGSTHLALVDLLPEDADLTVVTNAPAIAVAGLARGDLRVVTIGGAVDPAVGGCVDATAVAAIELIRVDRAFLGACALSVRDGVGASGHADAAFKRRVVARAATITVLATNDKIDARAPYQVVALARVDRLVVEHDLAAETREALAAACADALIVAAAA
jgi:DeoR/GlpR family transcriptional regulator of sugar metabolism